MPERSASEDGMGIYRKEEKMMEERQESVVLCGANSYRQNYYFNAEFRALPEEVQRELKALCVLFTEDVGGILTLEFLSDGTLTLNVTQDERDYLFDEIGSELKIRQIQREKEELLQSLETYFRVVFLGEEWNGQEEEE